MASERKRLTIDLDPAMQRRLKVLAALKGTSMRQYCIVAIERELAHDETTTAPSLPFGEEALDRLAKLQARVFQGRELPGDSVELLTEARAKAR